MDGGVNGGAAAGADSAAVDSYLRGLQERLLARATAQDGGAFARENWQGKLGQGNTAALLGGKVFERAGVNFSCIAGAALPPAASVRHPQLAGRPYSAAGVSAVFHPQNPYCPSAHLNVRRFCAGNVWWFGGGMDLTPYYGFAEDCRHFHTACKRALDPINPALYPQFKRDCDKYFYIPHRGEARGIGGVFFDDFNQGGFDSAFAVLRAVGDAFADAYFPLVARRAAAPFGARQRQWQLQRRGRYVEFNLVYDRGTLFGLQSGGRTEAILMSLPPAVAWGDGAPPTEEEAALAQKFLPPQKWAE